MWRTPGGTWEDYQPVYFDKAFWLNCLWNTRLCLKQRRAAHWACFASLGLNSDLWIIPFTTSSFKLAVWHTGLLHSSISSLFISLESNSAEFSIQDFCFKEVNRLLKFLLRSWIRRFLCVWGCSSSERVKLGQSTGRSAPNVSLKHV